MNTDASCPDRWRAQTVLVLAARFFVGALFIYMGLSKALHPIEFLKLVRQYDLFASHWTLNFVAAMLPWFEIFCGSLLILGVGVRGTAVMIVAMLVPFTVLIFLRALTLREASGSPLCTIKFDCGCGAGEVLVCRKLIENTLLTVLSAGLIFSRAHRLCLRHHLLKAA